MKTRPYPHQLREFEATRHLPAWALWWDQGTGKTKVIIDTMDWLWSQREITGVFIVAPGGVDANWVFDEITTHSAASERMAMLWRTRKVGTKRHDDAFAALCKWSGLSVLAMSYHAVMTDAGYKAARKFFGKHKGKLLMVVDEATAIKTPGAKTTIRVQSMARYAKYRRLLNGTPVEDSPFHAYSQCRWVQPALWKTELNIGDSGQFTDYFGEYVVGRGRGGSTYPQLVGYRNIEQLQRCMYKVGSRVMKDDVLDLPPKVYTKVYFDLDDKQAAAYRKLKRDLALTLDDGTSIDAELAVVRMTRFQQITSGYLPSDDDGDKLIPMYDKAAKNPRLKCLAELIPTISGQCIIWAKYNADIDAIAAELRAQKLTVRTYDGRTPKDERHDIVRGFQAGDFQFFVAKASSAGRGLTLTVADTVVYYNNRFSMDERKQSEDRAHRIGQKRSVRYVDIVALGTVDEHILSVLRGKREMSARILGDDLADWI